MSWCRVFGATSGSFWAQLKNVQTYEKSNYSTSDKIDAYLKRNLLGKNERNFFTKAEGVGNELGEVVHDRLSMSQIWISLLIMVTW
jgi:hypothetical protein